MRKLVVNPFARIEEGLRAVDGPAVLVDQAMKVCHDRAQGSRTATIMPDDSTRSSQRHPRVAALPECPDRREDLNCDSTR